MNSELISFSIPDVSDDKISVLSLQYMPMTIKGVDDKNGYKQVSTARKHLKSLRVQVDKRRLALTEEARKMQLAINKEAKRITALIEPIENHLSLQEKSYDDEVEKIKREQLAALKLKIQLRTDRLLALEFKFDGQQWIARYNDGHCNLYFKSESLSSITDIDFDAHILEFTNLYQRHLKEKEAAEFDAQMKREEENRRKIEEECAKRKAFDEMRARQIAEQERQQEEAKRLHEQKIAMEIKQAEIDAKAALLKVEEARIAEEKRTHEIFIAATDADEAKMEKEKNFSMRSGKAVTEEQKKTAQETIEKWDGYFCDKAKVISVDPSNGEDKSVVATFENGTLTSIKESLSLQEKYQHLLEFTMSCAKKEIEPFQIFQKAINVLFKLGEIE